MKNWFRNNATFLLFSHKSKTWNIKEGEGIGPILVLWMNRAALHTGSNYIFNSWTMDDDPLFCSHFLLLYMCYYYVLLLLLLLLIIV